MYLKREDVSHPHSSFEQFRKVCWAEVLPLSEETGPSVWGESRTAGSQSGSQEGLGNPDFFCVEGEKAMMLSGQADRV